MQLVSSLAHKLRDRRRYRTFAEMPSPLLALFAGGTGLVTFGFGVVLTRVVPWYMAAVEKVGWLNFDAMFWGCWILAVAIYAWLSASVFARCEKLLRDRWLQ